VRRTVGLLVALVAALSGCAGNNSKTAATTAPTGSSDAGSLPTAKRLATSLLQPADLGQGWSEVAIEPLGAELCGVIPLKSPGTTKARAEFVRVADSDLVQDGLTAYPAGGAAAAVAALRSATKNCRSYPVSVKNSATGALQEFNVAVEQLAIPATLGDERLGLRLDVLDAGGEPQRTLYGVVRRGDVIAALTVTGAQADRALFDRLLPIVDERLTKVAAS
jgi:hypothetical protein